MAASRVESGRRVVRLGEVDERVRDVMRRVVMRERVEERVVVPGMRFCNERGKEGRGGRSALVHQPSFTHSPAQTPSPSVSDSPQAYPWDM